MQGTDEVSMTMTMTVSEAARVLGISRSSAYECVRRGELRAVRLGRRLVVPRSAVTELLQGLQSETLDQAPQTGQ
jgi:excisionase family DNA binding protein